jgi:serine/threonine-protein kinase
MEEKRTEILNNRKSLNFQPGEVFAGRYRIIEKIGQGGMGEVFKATDLELSETVALKMIRPELSEKPEIVERFKRELQLARKINHPNVIRIHDLGSADGIRYISMKYIEGQSLKDLLRASGKLTIDKAIEISTQVADALNAAHMNGVVHRDLKPQNIMLDRNGNALVLDFGIARSVAETSLTGTGILIGTPDFMSPEQIHGEHADARTDIYSFGIILYEMVTGRLPFIADNPAILLHLHLHEKPMSPASLNKDVPKWLDGIILKCIEKKPENRFANFLEIKDALAHPGSRGVKNVKAGSKGLRVPWKKIVNPDRKWLRVMARIFFVALFLEALGTVPPSGTNKSDPPG